MLSVMIERAGCHYRHAQNRCGCKTPQQPMSSLLGKRCAARRNAFLSAQKRGFLVHIQINETRVIEFLARGWSAGRVQLLLHDGGTAFSRHQIRQLSSEESLSFFTIAVFLGIM